MATICVAGDRRWKDWNIIFNCLSLTHQKIDVKRIVHGGSYGAEKVAFEWASSHKVESKTIKSDWLKFNKKAGPKRCREVISYLKHQEYHPMILIFQDNITLHLHGSLVELIDLALRAKITVIQINTKRECKVLT